MNARQRRIRKRKLRRLFFQFTDVQELKGSEIRKKLGVSYNGWRNIVEDAEWFYTSGKGHMRPSWHHPH